MYVSLKATLAVKFNKEKATVLLYVAAHLEHSRGLQGNMRNDNKFIPYKKSYTQEVTPSYVSKVFKQSAYSNCVLHSGICSRSYK